MKVDILAFGAHPDDVELGCSGTLIKHVKLGQRVAIVDLSKGEMGTRGTAKERLREANDAASLMGVTARENLGLRDIFFSNDEQHQLPVVSAIRKYKPSIILCNVVKDRHPDHGKGAELILQSAFMAGLPKIKTREGPRQQDAWKVRSVFHYIQDYYHTPDFVVDISDVMERRMKAILAFRSQFYNPASREPETAISTKEFIEFLYARAREMGRLAGYTFGEGFLAARPVGVKNLEDLE